MKRLWPCYRILLFFTLLSSFQNCSPTVFETSVRPSNLVEGPSQNPQQPNADIFAINGNDKALFHQTGTASNTNWIALPKQAATEKFLNYGPYFEIPMGYKKVIFDIEALEPNQLTNDVFRVLTLDIYDSTLKKVVAKKEIWLEDLKAADSPYYLVFNSARGSKYEFRSYYYGGAAIKLKSIRVRNVDYGIHGDLFDKRNRFEKSGFVPGGNGWIVVHNKTWYHFDRKFSADAATPDFCKNTGTLSIVVRKSNDKGQTWSDPQVVIANSAIETQDDACYVVDGTTFFDNSSQKWLTFSQCLGKIGAPWTMCLYEATDVAGPYVRHDIGFKPGKLWTPICSGSGKSCPAGVFDEGTPDHVYTKRGWHYFTFHGYDGQKGYRGIARTKDFIIWQTEGPDLTNDALLTEADCQSWNPGCIGAGHSASLRSGDFIYQLWEGPTINLSCTDNQYWPFGLSRSFQFERSKNWETGPINPYLVPISNYLCGTQYARFVVDENELYMFYDYAESSGRNRTDKFYLYKWKQGAQIQKTLTYSASENSLRHQVGQLSGAAWVSAASDVGFLSYGPYTSAWNQGVSQISFSLSADNVNLLSTEPVVRIDLYDSTFQKTIFEKIIYEKELFISPSIQSFALPMPFDNLGDNLLEARVYVYGRRAVRLHAITAF